MKLISCNIEGHRHFEERVIPFLESEKPDVVCLQEVFEVDMPRLQEVLGMEGNFQAISNVNRVSVHQSKALGNLGIAIFSRLENQKYQAHFYVRKSEKTPLFFGKDDPNNMHRIVLALTAQHQGREYTIATTHFTWSPEGSFTKEQQEAYQAMEEVLDDLPPHILCGDFNSPRIWLDEQKTKYQQNVFGRLAQKYRDNIPKEVETSIDAGLHKAGALQLMVDGLFSHQRYQLSEVKVVDGVSDHQAIVATVL
jgi:endonuclease/exonuclease/phosphatase family metal-dependent hydrolase